jgi:hypothetical protein
MGRHLGGVRMEDHKTFPTEVDVEGAMDCGLRRIRCYLDRGRPLADLSAGDLDRRFVAAFRCWARNVEDRGARTGLENAVCEYSLRDEEPPYERVQAEVDSAMKMIAGRCRSSIQVKVLDFWSAAERSFCGLPN